MAVKVLQLDETGYWAPSIAERAGKIIGVYLYHDDLHVHCCELTPSYELHFVGSFYTASNLEEDEWEKLDEEIREGNVDQELVTYMHCSRVDAMPQIKDFGCDSIGTCTYHGADEEDRDRIIEDAQEWLRANSSIV